MNYILDKYPISQGYKKSIVIYCIVVFMLQEWEYKNISIETGKNVASYIIVVKNNQSYQYYI